MTMSGIAADHSTRVPDEAELVQLARRITQWRRRRDRLFDALAFADPEWDILLDLFAENGAGRSVSMSSLCIAAAVPTTTAVRCINALVAQNMLVRMGDPDDARRVLLKLSGPARMKMRQWLIEVADSLTGI